jgi:hypothetical protein
MPRNGCDQAVDITTQEAELFVFGRQEWKHRSRTIEISGQPKAAAVVGIRDFHKHSASRRGMKLHFAAISTEVRQPPCHPEAAIRDRSAPFSRYCFSEPNCEVRHFAVPLLNVRRTNRKFNTSALVAVAQIVKPLRLARYIGVLALLHVEAQLAV